MAARVGEGSAVAGSSGAPGAEAEAASCGPRAVDESMSASCGGSGGGNSGAPEAEAEAASCGPCAGGGSGGGNSGAPEAEAEAVSCGPLAGGGSGNGIVLTFSLNFLVACCVLWMIAVADRRSRANCLVLESFAASKAFCCFSNPWANCFNAKERKDSSSAMFCGFFFATTVDSSAPPSDGGVRRTTALRTRS